MADKGDLGVSPYSKVSLDIEVNVATDVPMPLHFTNDRATGAFQPSVSVFGIAAGGVEGVRVTANGIKVLNGTAVAAGGVTAGGVAPGITFTSNATQFGIFTGSGAPTFTAQQGSLYMRTDGSSVTRGYLAMNSSGLWTAINTAN